MYAHILSLHNVLLVIALILALMAALGVPPGPKTGWAPWSWVFFIAAFLFWGTVTL